MKAQKPAQGILLNRDYGGAMHYTIPCDCGCDEHSHHVWIEADDSTKRFRWYRDSSRVEYINLSADQRKGYYQFVEWQNMQLPV